MGDVFGSGDPKGFVDTTTLQGNEQFRRTAQPFLESTIRGDFGPLGPGGVESARAISEELVQPVVSQFAGAGRGPGRSGLIQPEVARVVANQGFKQAATENERRLNAARSGPFLQSVSREPFFENDLAQILGALLGTNALLGGGSSLFDLGKSGFDFLRGLFPGSEEGDGSGTPPIPIPKPDLLNSFTSNPQAFGDLLGFDVASGASQLGAAPGLFDLAGNALPSLAGASFVPGAVTAGGVTPGLFEFLGGGGPTFGAGNAAGGALNPGISGASGGAFSTATPEQLVSSLGQGAQTGLNAGDPTQGFNPLGFFDVTNPSTFLGGGSLTGSLGLAGAVLGLSQIGAGPAHSLEGAKSQINSGRVQTLGRENGGRTGDNQPRTVAWNDPQLAHSALADALAQTSAPALWNGLSESGRQNLAKTLKRPNVPAGVFPTHIWRGSLGEGKAAQNSGLGEGIKYWQAQWSDGQTSSGRSEAFASRPGANVSGFDSSLSAAENRARGFSPLGREIGEGR